MTALRTVYGLTYLAHRHTQLFTRASEWHIIKILPNYVARSFLQDATLLANNKVIWLLENHKLLHQLIVFANTSQTQRLHSVLLRREIVR